MFGKVTVRTQKLETCLLGGPHWTGHIYLFIWQLYLFIYLFICLFISRDNDDADDDEHLLLS